MPLIAIRLNDDLLNRLDKLVPTYGNRSEAVRVAVTLLSAQTTIQASVKTMIQVLEEAKTDAATPQKDA